MKTRNVIIICLSIIGIIIFGLFQFVIIPKNNQKTENYILSQQNPITHDLNTILEYKSKYMGSASNIGNLFYNLPLNDLIKSFELSPDNLTLQVNCKNKDEVNEEMLNKALIYNSTAVFALVDNLEKINYNFSDFVYSFSRADVEKWYGEDLSSLIDKDKWKEKVQDKIKNKEYVNDCIKEILKKK
ncbi:MAG: DUF4825 domain-containing protein [Clostridium argentinense]|uniref:DUF4825 domain-containing protein n=1 Tax=Clostridium faecium TaxID=2762223 RepID=A0ABR8YUE8_9CLOT|nr:DUF4825 domain-containing protein [Clostridium faecium]MBD8047855.1 DUF4825 domain-containing protein [Clostridium faecium]MBS5823393.1 DUF4825 domain-containing protein [Clostridium argentinense]